MKLKYYCFLIVIIAISLCVGSVSAFNVVIYSNTNDVVYEKVIDNEQMELIKKIVENFDSKVEVTPTKVPVVTVPKYLTYEDVLQMYRFNDTEVWEITKLGQYACYWITGAVHYYYIAYDYVGGDFWKRGNSVRLPDKWAGYSTPSTVISNYRDSIKRMDNIQENYEVVYYVDGSRHRDILLTPSTFDMLF